MGNPCVKADDAEKKNVTSLTKNLLRFHVRQQSKFGATFIQSTSKIRTKGVDFSGGFSAGSAFDFVYCENPK